MYLKRSVQFVLVTLLFGLALAACEQRPPESIQTGDISRQELSDRLSNGTAPVILDVRSADEYNAGHVPGAVNIPHDEVKARASELAVEPGEEIVIHCQSGRRAALAQADLENMGFTNIRPLEGHWAGWTEAGLPVE